MRLSSLIEALEVMRLAHGDAEVRVETGDGAVPLSGDCVQVQVEYGVPIVVVIDLTA